MLLRQRRNARSPDDPPGGASRRRAFSSPRDSTRRHRGRTPFRSEKPLALLAVKAALRARFPMSLPAEARFPLVPQREHEDHIVRFNEVIEGNVARLASRYDQRSQAAFRRPSDRRVALKDLQCVKDKVDSGTSGDEVIASEKFKDAAEIGLRACR